MNAEVKSQWINALRSDKYKQTYTKLRNKNSFCVLGVLCDIYNSSLWSKDNKFDKEMHYLPDSVSTWARLDSCEEETVSLLNDKGHSFSHLANYIEENL